MAEFVFYRFFDVGMRKILDKIVVDKIAGIEGMSSHLFETYYLKFLNFKMKLHSHLWVFRRIPYILYGMKLFLMHSSHAFHNFVQKKEKRNDCHT